MILSATKIVENYWDSLLDIRRSWAKKRVNITDDTREDFQNESQDRIYDDLETSDLLSKADNEDSEEPLNPSLLDRNDTKDDKNDFWCYSDI
ncbi:unnamed protein product [Rhizophagus irregularis]|nr:unnamed protein product [Rhizophagus irregularis]